jgi:hypothetical protein
VNIEDILKFEDNELLFTFKFEYDELLMWPFVRFNVVDKILSPHSQVQIAKPLKKELTFFTKLNYVKDCIFRNPFIFCKKYKILIFGGSVATCVKRDNKWFNRVNDYFADEYPDQTLLIESSDNMKYKFPRYLPHVSCHDFIRMAVYACSKIKKKHISEEEKNRIKSFIDLLKERFESELDDLYCEQLQKDLESIAGKLEYAHYFYKKLFNKYKPKIIFVEDGSYGREGYIIKWAKDFGIKIGEFQHGIIVNNSQAYNYASIICKGNEYKKYLPDYLLTYAEYWHSKTRTPVNKVVIGNPHFTSQIDKYRTIKSNKKDKKIILVISQGTVTELMVNLTRDLSEIIDSEVYKIVFRLHPGEIPYKEKYSSLENIHSVVIDFDSDIYELMAKSDVVIGSSSTAVYEASGFQKPVFINDNPNSRLYVSTDYGTWFKDAHELFSLIKTGKNNDISDLSYYWGKDWKENYKSFLAKYTGITAGEQE